MKRFDSTRWATAQISVPTFLFVTLLSTGCGLVSSATKSGMKPILENGVQGFVDEPDIGVAGGALAANIKLIEGIVRTYPDDREFRNLAAMARANYTFAVLEEELEAVRIATPHDQIKVDALVLRIEANYGVARTHAESALAESDGWADSIAGRRLEDVTIEEFDAALASLEQEDAESLFWLAFAWGGTVKNRLDPAEATQLPKIEHLVARVIELDETVFYAVGPHMLAGGIYGYRSPALGGDPEKALKHFARARELGGILLPLVLSAQYVYAQTDRQADFESALETVIAAEPNRERLLFDRLAQRKACRLLANVDQFFLTDAKEPPKACSRVAFDYALRAEPLEPTTDVSEQKIDDPSLRSADGPSDGQP